MTVDYLKPDVDQTSEEMLIPLPLWADEDELKKKWKHRRVNVQKKCLEVHATLKLILKKFLEGKESERDFNFHI